MKKTRFTLLFSFIAVVSMAQKSVRQDTAYINHFQYVRTSAYSHIDVVRIDESFLTNLLKPYGFSPNPILNNTAWGVDLTAMKKRLYLNVNCSWRRDTRNKTNEAWLLDQRLASYGLLVGHNAIIRQRFVLSPYIGLKYYRFRNITSPKGVSSLATFLQNPDIDLRINQLAATVGLNFTFFLKKPNLAVGFYMGYLQKLHDNALLYSTGHRLENTSGSPLKSLNWGLSFGYGISRK